MKINAGIVLVLSSMAMFTAQAADESNLTKICLDGKDVNQVGLFNTIVTGRWFDRDNMTGSCELMLIEDIGPIYPESAYTSGAEGWARVSFTVTEEGLVVNARILDAKPLGIFDQSAIRAAELLRFEPRMVSGQPVVVDNVTHVFNFNM